MIYTFYSYKGGVGRSMALANIAESFRDKDLRVLMIDWDLEAPGLETFFYPREKIEQESIRGHVGLMELLTRYKSTYVSLTNRRKGKQLVDTPAAAADAESRRLPSFLRESVQAAESAPASSLFEALDQLFPSLDEYLIAMPATSRGALSLMPAGNRSEQAFSSYARSVQDFDWTAFYANYEGRAFFDWFGRKLEEVADVTLIDSRTGVTEMGGVCTRQLADVVVSFIAPNNQNVDGTMRIVRTLDKSSMSAVRGDRELQIVVVPTRIDNTESISLGAFETRFKDATEQFGRIPDALQKEADAFWRLRIPYIPKFNYEEQRVIGPGAADPKAPTDQLIRAYRRLAAALAVTAPPAHRLRQNFAAEIPLYFAALGPQLLISYEGAKAARIADRLRIQLRAANVELWPDLDHHVPNENWKANIDRTRGLIVPLTPENITSSTLRSEVRYARQMGKAVHFISDGILTQSDVPSWAKDAIIEDLEHSDSLLQKISAPQRAPRVPLMRPEVQSGPLSPGFTERLLQLVNKTDGGYSILNGSPGACISVIASQLCDLDPVVETFVDGILWLDLGEAPNIPNLWREACLALFDEAPATPEEIQRQVTTRLSKGRFLIVLNDVWSEQQIDQLPRPGPGCKGLILTSGRGWKSKWQAVTVDPDVGTEEATSILSSAAAIDPESTIEIVSECARSRLVLRCAAAYYRAEISSSDAASGWSNLLGKLRGEGVAAFDVPNAVDSVSRAIQNQLARLERADRVRLMHLTELSENGFSVEQAKQQLNISSESEILRFLSQLHNLFFVTLIRPETPGLEPGKVVERSTVLPDRLFWRFQQRRATTPKPTGIRAVASAENAKTDTAVAQAKAVLSGVDFADTARLMDLAETLKKQGYFDFAQQILGRALSRDDRNSAQAEKIAQQLALCTYKNTRYPVEQRLPDALQILEHYAHLKETTSPETLGIAGGIYKEWWKYDAQREHLESSVFYYLRGASSGVEVDYGYTALNAAFVLDLLTRQESLAARDTTASTPGVEAQVKQAKDLRESIVTTLPALIEKSGNARLSEQWWILVTMGEAYFGLRRYDEALFWLRRGLDHRGADWEYQATARQLAWMTNLVEDSDASEDTKTAARETLRFFLGNDAVAAAGLRLGKVGLALSGGGFRASFFHIGVLARLAEFDLLRHVEVLSCVSGGSIIGALYYLELKKLLELKLDSDITCADYIDIVQRISRDFTAAVQKNLRTRLGWNPWISLMTALRPHFTRTSYLGELYEQCIFRRSLNGSPHGKIWIDELTVHPPGEPEDFAPKLDNWRRSAKVPVLILNATSLNTGHNWQFAASWMGEPPFQISSEVDTDDRLRRMYYWEAPEPYRRVRLGAAVAASSCVPGLFEPLAMPGLYPKRNVQLIDGGVHDNQGTASLLEQECTVLLVSDASGQMRSQLRPAPEVTSVPLRVSSILQSRLRQAEFMELDSRRRSSLLRGLLFLHLKKDLGNNPVAWTSVAGDPIAHSASSQTAPLTAYGIDREAQKSISAIRTDLDAFHDTEAAALMLSGYRMTGRYLAESVPAFPAAGATGRDWWFLQIEAQLGSLHAPAIARKSVMRLLEKARFRAFRSLRLMPGIALFTCISAMYLVWKWEKWLYSSTRLTANKFGWITLIVAAVLALWFAVMRLRGSKSLSQFVLGLLLIPGSVAIWAQLLVFDRLYLAFGRLPDSVTRPGRSVRWERGLALLRFVELMLLIVFLAELPATPWLFNWPQPALVQPVSLKPLVQGPASTHASQPISGTVVIQISDEAQSTAARELASTLKDEGLLVSPVEIVGPARTPRVTQVRYFFPEDEKLADQVADVMSTQGYKATVISLSAKFYPAATRGAVEVWFGRDLPTPVHLIKPANVAKQRAKAVGQGNFD